MNENNSTKVNTIRIKANGSNHEFHPDTQTSRLLIANQFHQNILTKYSKVHNK